MKIYSSVVVINGAMARFTFRLYSRSVMRAFMAQGLAMMMTNVPSSTGSEVKPNANTYETAGVRNIFIGIRFKVTRQYCLR